MNLVVFGLTAFVVILAIIFCPLIFIWSVNTLFKVGIEYTFWTWLAALVLAIPVSGGAASRARK